MSTKSITLSIWYRERIALPPGTQVEVLLEETSRADAPATVVSWAWTAVASGPPYDLVLAYDPAMLDPRGRYGIRVRVLVEGVLTFTTTEYIPAFEHHEHEPLAVMVSKV